MHIYVCSSLSFFLSLSQEACANIAAGVSFILEVKDIRLLTGIVKPVSLPIKLHLLKQKAAMINDE